jgi:hypothetical protein
MAKGKTAVLKHLDNFYRETPLLNLDSYNYTESPCCFRDLAQL